MTGKQNFTPLIDENWWQSGGESLGETKLHRNISLTPNEVDQLIVADLIYMWDLENSSTDEDGLPIKDEKLMDAIEVVLDYYMSPAQFNDWLDYRG